MDSALVLAFDIGTSSLRTALFDSAGCRLTKTTAQESYTLRTDDKGRAELAIPDLERAAVRALGATLSARRKTSGLNDRPIAAVATSCFWHSLVGYDARRGKPTPVYTWADARCREDARLLRGRLRERSYHARTGCMLRTPYWPAKLRWLARTGGARGITEWMSPAEWLYRRLAGTSRVGLSMASGTGLLDLRTGDWDESLLRTLKIKRKMLGEISDEPLRANHGDRVAAVPLLAQHSELKEAVWFPAIGDGAASNLGSDAITPGLAALNVGTSAAIRLVVAGRRARILPGLFCHRVDAGRCLLGGAISNAGNLRHWAVEQMRLPDQPGALERALAARQGPHGDLTVLPFWTGERCPSWPEAVGGTITGITYSTTALDLLQALVESSYHRLAQLADLLEKQNGGSLRGIVVSGGIRHSAESLQRLANVLGRPVRPCLEPEASLRGAAVHALAKLGYKVEPLARAKEIKPKEPIARLYAEARAAQVVLERKLGR